MRRKFFNYFRMSISSFDELNLFFKRCSEMPGLKNEKLHKACTQPHPTDASTRLPPSPCERFHRTVYSTEVQLRHGGRVL